MKRLLFLSILLITFVLVTPVAGQLAPIQVTNNTYFDFVPQIAVDPLGNAYLTWQGDEGDEDAEIFWAKVDPSGTITTVQITDNTYSDYNPQIAVDASGNSYLTWVGQAASEFEIFWASVDPTGIVNVTSLVTNNSYEDHSPQIAIDSSGNSYLTWFQNESFDDYEIFWASVNSSGSVSSPTQVTNNTSPDYDPQITTDPSGNSYLTWYGLDGDDYDIFWAKLNSSGVVTNSTQITNNTYYDYCPQIAIDSLGNSYLTWHGEVGGEDYEVFWAKVDSLGALTTTQVTDNAYNEGDSQIATDPSGNSYLTWYGEEGGDDNEIFWAKVDPTGSVTNTTQVTDNTYEDEYPMIATDSLGNSYLVWQGEAEEDNPEIFWAGMDPSGAVTDIIRGTDNNDNDEHPQIAADPSGISYITWPGREGGDYEIFFINSVMLFMDAASNKPSPLIFRVLANTQLARANSIWNCISENLPGEIPAGFQAMINEAQIHMANAASLSNPIYSNGELVRAISIMEDINKALELNCYYD